MEKVFVRRKEELDKLNNAFKSTRLGYGKLVLIEGNAGIGKSALVREFLKSSQDDSSVIVSDIECNDKENLNAYAPFKEILIKLNAEATEKNEKEEDDVKTKKKETRKKLKKFISDAGASWIGLIPLVGGFASAGIETYKAYKNSFGGQLPDNEAQSEGDVYKIFENEFRRLAENKTLVIFIDDLQWADASSLNLIFALSKSIRANPFRILIIGTYRPDEIKIGRKKTTEHGDIVTVRHPFADKLNELRNYTKKENHVSENYNWLIEIELHEFPFDEVIFLINNSFPNNKFDDNFYCTIFNLTNGQALFLIEILELLSRNNNIIKNKHGQYEIQNLDFQELPVSVNAVINEKIERLDEHLKKILSYASISGEKFIIQEFEKVLKIDEFELLDYLEILNKKYDLLTEEESVTVNDLFLDLYSFSQTLVHRVIYDSMDNSRRRRLHKHIAATIKSIYGDELKNNAQINSKYNQHIQIAQGLIDGKTLLISKIEPISEQNNEIYEILLEAASDEIKKAEESAKQWADVETLTFAEKALAFLSKIEHKNEETEKIRYEAYYNKWHALYTNSKWDAGKICDNMAKVTDFFENIDSPLAEKYRNRTAMAYTLHYGFKEAKEYFFTKKNIELVSLDEGEIEDLVKNGQYDKVCDLYFDWAKINKSDIDDEYVLLTLGIAMLNHSKENYLKKAEKFLVAAYMIFEDDSDHVMTTKSSYYVGVTKFKLEKFKEAKFYLEKALVRYERWKDIKSLDWNGADIYKYLDNIGKIINK